MHVSPVGSRCVLGPLGVSLLVGNGRSHLLKEAALKCVLLVPWRATAWEARPTLVWVSIPGQGYEGRAVALVLAVGGHE